MLAPDVSVVLPLYRNSASMQELVERLAKALADEKFEIIGVDDACPEVSGEVLLSSAASLGVETRLIRHARNLGQNRAVLAGLQEARGRHIVVMDSDLQDPPEEIPRLLAEARTSGVQVVFGRRVGTYRRLSDELTSYVFKWLLFRLANCGFDPRIGLFFVLDSEARMQLVAPRGAAPYVMAMLACAHPSWCSVAYERHARSSGRSAYSFKRRFVLAINAFHCYAQIKREGRL
ncbi:glycosyltransferase [Ferribacterium limneticum]|uniref:glycosyltransferase n=1 Tax=Ferribacterium limneticum TaxID=76259 RepID=UPI001CF9B448|nr:glycosyltransferase [Ferribacterium limneticum]UCV20287.1 glycosyltransferase [Ferribacterium limneticum]